MPNSPSLVVTAVKLSVSQSKATVAVAWVSEARPTSWWHSPAPRESWALPGRCSLQAIEAELAARGAQALDGAAVERSEHAADGGDVGKAAQAEEALHHRSSR